MHRGVKPLKTARQKAYIVCIPHLKMLPHVAYRERRRMIFIQQVY